MFWTVMRKIYRRIPPATEKELEEAYGWHEWRCRMEKFWDSIQKMPHGQQRQNFLDQYARNNNAMWQIEPDMWGVVTRSWSYKQCDRTYRREDEEDW